MKICASDCWRIMPVTVEELRQWLLMNNGSGCWTIVPAVFFFSLFNFTLAKSLPVCRVNASIIITDYFNSGSQLSKLQVYWLIIILIFSLYMFYQPLQPSKTLAKLNKVGIVGKPLVRGTSLHIFCQKLKKGNCKKPDECFQILNLFIYRCYHYMHL